jgi:hypothetical protein
MFISTSYGTSLECRLRFLGKREDKMLEVKRRAIWIKLSWSEAGHFNNKLKNEDVDFHVSVLHTVSPIH